jgi:arylsulfatase A-like enzyme
MITRLIVCLGLLSLFPPGPAPAADAPKKRPNVLFLFTDDQRADTIRALGNPVIQTPNLDRLAASGFVFRNAYCMGSTVPAVCMPSRTMMITGRSLFHLPALKADAPNFPRTLNDAGYATYHYGKRGNTPQSIQKEFAENHYLSNDQKERSSGYPGKEVADDAIRYLKAHKKDKPFFLYLAFGNPHDPRVVNAEYRGKYDEAKMPLPRNYRPFHPFNNGELLVRDEQLAPWPRTEAVVRKHLTDYYGVITYLDMEIGRVLQALKDIGAYDNTIIVFSSDHGLAVGSHGLFGKQNVYEDGMKTPLIFAGPGVPKGRSDAFAYLYDIYPTVCELAGVPVPKPLDGKSLGPVIRGETKGVRDRVFLAYRAVQRAVRQGDWKLIRYPQVNRTQLFNLKDDPDETKDLAGDPKHAEKVKELLALLAKLQKEYGDTQPLTVDNPQPAEVDLSFFKK